MQFPPQTLPASPYQVQMPIIRLLRNNLLGLGSQILVSQARAVCEPITWSIQFCCSQKRPK